MQVVIATRNRDKAKELETLLGEFRMTGKTLNDIDPEGKIPEVEEVGSTLKENAFIKAKKIFSMTEIPTIADDTGLEVDALNGAPGVYSARYAGEGCSYEDNVNRLLREMEGLPRKRRHARFKTVVCYVDTDQELWTEGVVEGMITERPVGHNGFGYDPVFYVLECKKTYAQLTDSEKNTWSHRGKAMRKLMSLLSEDLVPTAYPS